MDSCGELGMLFRIALPLSKPMLSTVALFSALAYWNDWINGLYYLTRRSDLYSIQNVLNSMMNNVQFLKENTLDAGSAQITTQIPHLRSENGNCGNFRRTDYGYLSLLPEGVY